MKRQAKPRIDFHKHEPKDCKAAVVGLGLMGTSITACLLAAGHPVAGLEKDASRRRATKDRVFADLKKLAEESFLKRDPQALINNLTVTSSYSDLADATLVIESITENLDSKVEALLQLEAVVSPGTLIATNTSAIPITQIQKKMSFPGRALGMHWDEPAHVTIFMEIIKGDLTSPVYLNLAKRIAQTWWGKNPSQVSKDIKGFIANRISYAMFREACHLVDSGVATIEDVDRSLRNDVGWWSGFAGPFRYMDLMGIRAYETVMRDLLPDLSSGKEVPQVMTRAAGHIKGKGTRPRGFYSYAPGEAKRWEEKFVEYTFEIRRLTAKYSSQDDRTS